MIKLLGRLLAPVIEAALSQSLDRRDARRDALSASEVEQVKTLADERIAKMWKDAFSREIIVSGHLSIAP